MDRLLTVVALGMVMLALLAAAGWLTLRIARHMVRRRWRRWVGAAAGGLAAEGLRASARLLASRPFTSPGWWVAQADRHRMWRAVASARQAVDRAVAAGAPTGELPRLVTALEGAAADLDRLVASQPGAPGTARSEVAALVEASADLRDAAVTSLRGEAAPRVSSLTAAVRAEAEAVRTGVGVAGGTRPGGTGSAA